MPFLGNRAGEGGWIGVAGLRSEADDPESWLLMAVEAFDKRVSLLIGGDGASFGKKELGVLSMLLSLGGLAAAEIGGVGAGGRVMSGALPFSMRRGVGANAGRSGDFGGISGCESVSTGFLVGASMTLWRTISRSRPLMSLVGLYNEMGEGTPLDRGGATVDIIMICLKTVPLLSFVHFVNVSGAV